MDTPVCISTGKPGRRNINSTAVFLDKSIDILSCDIAFHSTGFLLGIPIMGYNEPYNKWYSITPPIQPKQPGLSSLLICKGSLYVTPTQTSCTMFFGNSLQNTPDTLVLACLDPIRNMGSHLMTSLVK